MAILELVVNQRYFNQLIVNRFHYVSGGTPAAVTPSFALISATGYLAGNIVSGAFASGTLARYIQDAQVDALTYVSAYARNLYSVTDFYESPYAANVNGGQGTDQGASVFEALGFFSSRVRTDIRRGQKRFAGYSQAYGGSGGVLAPASDAARAAIATALGAVLTYDDEGNTLTFSPAILGLEKIGTPPNVEYQFYETESEQMDHVATGILWQPYATVRSQTSRQYGNGA